MKFRQDATTIVADAPKEELEERCKQIQRFALSTSAALFFFFEYEPFGSKDLDG